MDIPTTGSVLFYGKALKNVQSAPVERRDLPSLPKLRSYMVGIMQRYKGCGLSAPQVGVFKQVIIIGAAGGQIIDMVNPEITRMYGRELLTMEGCLSVPPVRNGCMVPRMQFITVEYGTVDDPMTRRVITLENQNSIIGQHEIDHLSGTFFFDRVQESAKQKVLAEFYKWKEERNAKKGAARSLTTARA